VWFCSKFCTTCQLRCQYLQHHTTTTSHPSLAIFPALPGCTWSLGQRNMGPFSVFTINATTANNRDKPTPTSQAVCKIIAVKISSTQWRSTAAARRGRSAMRVGGDGHPRHMPSPFGWMHFRCLFPQRHQFSLAGHLSRLDLLAQSSQDTLYRMVWGINC
jgi:hypothetical protein